MHIATQVITKAVRAARQNDIGILEKSFVKSFRQEMGEHGDGQHE